MVIRQVKAPKAVKKYRHTCTNTLCEAQWEFETDDLSMATDIERGPSYIFSCPHCKSQVQLTTAQLNAKIYTGP